ncbi:MAG: FGGY family carbohydrate kinase, partial [bacterium]
MSLLGIDIGTSGCKAVVLSEDGRCLGHAACEHRPHHPAAGLCEFDAAAVWRGACEVIRSAMHATGADPVTALCVSALGEAVVPVTRDRRIVGPSILSSDPRGGEYAEALIRDFGEEAFYRINRNLAGPQYTLPKLLWLREHEPALYARAELFLTWSDFAGFMLGAEPTCNNSHASRTHLFDFEADDWSERLLAWAELDRARLGRIVPGGIVVGTVSAAMAAELGMPPGVAIVAGGHDQCLNALGCGCVAPGRAVCGIGTYECITPVYRTPDDPLALFPQRLNVERHVLPGLCVSFLFNQSGSLVRWFRDTFAAAEVAAPDLYARLAAEIPDAPTRLLVLPHFDPPPWPERLPEASGVIAGLKSTTTRGEILKAIMEGATFHFVEGVAALRRLGIDTTEFVASGGGARSDAWLQIKADILGVPFVRLATSECGATGAAMLAGIATGCYGSPDDAVAAHVRRVRSFEPDAQRQAYYAELFGCFRQLHPALRTTLRDLSALP